MTRDSEVSMALRGFVENQVTGNFTGKVVSVDKKAAALTVEFSGNLFTVKLRSIINNSAMGMVLYPAVGSQVFCVAEGNSSSRFIALGFEQVEELAYTEGDITMKINADGVVFNGGSLGGLVKIEQLKNNIDSLKSYVEAINSALPSAFTAIGVGPAASGPSGAAAYSSSMSGRYITIQDMENQKVKH